MPPQQYLHKKQYLFSADCFSLGVVICVLLGLGTKAIERGQAIKLAYSQLSSLSAEDGQYQSLLREGRRLINELPTLDYHDTLLSLKDVFPDFDFQQADDELVTNIVVTINDLLSGQVTAEQALERFEAMQYFILYSNADSEYTEEETDEDQEIAELTQLLKQQTLESKIPQLTRAKSAPPTLYGQEDRSTLFTRQGKRSAPDYTGPGAPAPSAMAVESLRDIESPAGKRPRLIMGAS